ncbi:MAG: mandelate racemase [Armatimonadetes bacterium]|nr:mandelate racemase [Armatimonadota bacterium]
MKITAIVDEVVPIRSEISNAYISFREMTASAVAIHTDVVRDGRPIVGYGFNSNGRYGQRGILRDRVIPRLMAAPPETLLDDTGQNFDAAKAWRVMMANEKPGGHGERSVAVGTIDMALWDLIAKIAGKPLYVLLAERYRRGDVNPKVEVYAAGGYYYPEKGINGLLEELRAYLDLGYTTVKIKIGGAPLADDVARIEAVLALLHGDQQLAVDANGRFDLDEAMAYRDALSAHPLKWYEEPCDPLDFEILARVADGSPVPIATGENLFSLPDARNLIRYGGMDPARDFIQVDPALSYGLVEYLRILAMLEANGWSRRRCVPHGGHQFALHIAAGLGIGGNESYPGVFQPFGGFADDVPVVNGRVGLPDAPGIGVERKANLWEVFRTL